MLERGFVLSVLAVCGSPLGQLFEAESEAFSATHQKELFFDEVEAEGAPAQSVADDDDDGEGDQVDVPAHKRAKRGRKPLDPALPREVVRHELPEGERTCLRDGAALAPNQSTALP